MTVRFFKSFSEDVDDLLGNTSSVANVECWIEERLIYAKYPKAKNENLTKNPHVNMSSNTGSQNYINPVDYESINADLDLTQESVDTKFLKEIQFLDLGECEIIDELDLWELGTNTKHNCNTYRRASIRSVYVRRDRISGHRQM